MFFPVADDGEKSDVELGERIVPTIGFVRMIEVDVGAGSIFRRTADESVVDGEDDFVAAGEAAGQPKPFPA